MAPTGLEVYVANKGDNTLSVINTVTKTVVATLTGLSAPLGVATSRDSVRLYVANSGANTVSVIDTVTRTVIATMPVGTTPWGVAASPDGHQVYVANNGSDNVSVIDTSTNTVTDTIAVGHQPTGVAVTPNGLYVYVANSGSNTVSVIQTLNAMAPTLGPPVRRNQGDDHRHQPDRGHLGQIRHHPRPHHRQHGQPGRRGLPARSRRRPGHRHHRGRHQQPQTVHLLPQRQRPVPGPGAGPTAGRNVITIRGAQLATATQVLFGSVPALPLIVSDQQITVAVPPGVTPGCVPVTVTTAGGLTTGTLTYTYVDPPQLTGLSTTTGSAFGGNVIDLTGQNLATTTKVTFNGAVAQFSIGSNTVLAAVVPPSPTTGPADVTVTTAAGTPTLPGAYLYT